MGSKGWTLAGNTYPVKDQIKAMGGQWDAQSKTWTVPYGTMAEKSSRGQTIYRLRSAGVTVR